MTRPNRPDPWAAGIMLALIILVVWLLQGCDSRRQAAADAVAGIQVLRAEQPASVREPVADAAQQLAAAAAGTTLDRLPPPQILPEQIPARIPEYQAQAANAATSTGWWLAVGGWTIAALGIVAGVVRVAGIGGPIVGIVAGIVEGAAAKRERERQASLAGAALTMVDVVEQLDLPQVKKAISKNVTPEQDAAIRQRLAEKVVVK